MVKQIINLKIHTQTTIPHLTNQFCIIICVFVHLNKQKKNETFIHRPHVLESYYNIATLTHHIYTCKLFVVIVRLCIELMLDVVVGIFADLRLKRENYARQKPVACIEYMNERGLMPQTFNITD